MESTWDKIEPLLTRVSRPGRYVGNELHAVRKDWQDVIVKFALAFPDVYEIGMSHVGMGILYHILNKQDWILAERVYSPWRDMEMLMREENVPLLSLESKQPVHRFDVLGISLQYELQYTNVLNLIDLAGIPVRSEERGERDPLVVAGGPCAYNPEPLVDFLDAVVLGDGEEVAVEIAKTVRKSKREKRSRKESLRALARLKGVYIPSFYSVRYGGDGLRQAVQPTEERVPENVVARTVDVLSPEFYPEKPVVPLIGVTHDRLSLEIMRGCTRGCRFCNAGMAYRPVRERRVDDLVAYAKTVMASTGYDEISLLSLSTSDYSALPGLLAKLRQAFDHKGVSLSFPSLRPDSFTEEMAGFAVGLRRSGLTLAPEAGTQRLRDVINKNNTEEDLLKAVEIAFERDWRQIKLYFMVGLPTETREDVEGIVDLVGKVVRLGRGYGKKEIHVSISPFSPKPQTPFQWEAQDSPDILAEKIALLKRGIRWPDVKLNWRDVNVSRLEAVLGRGDRQLGDVIERAWQEGARFDAWTDEFDYQRWVRAFEASGLSLDTMTAERVLDHPLPWDHLSKGHSKSFLVRERAKALAGETTGDCREGVCHGCGLMDLPACREVARGKSKSSQKTEVASVSAFGRSIKKSELSVVSRRVCVAYTKDKALRFTSHLDLVRIFTRALRRANIPLVMSRGFHAHPRITTGPPLPLGYTSSAEYLTLEIRDHVPRELERILNRHLPEGLRVFGYEMIHGKSFSLNELINRATYRIALEKGITEHDIEASIGELLSLNSYVVTRKSKKQEKSVDIRPYVAELACQDHAMHLTLKMGQHGTARVDEVMAAILSSNGIDTKELRVERTGLFIEEKGRRMTPLTYCIERE